MYSSQTSHHKHRQFSELPTAAKSHLHEPQSPHNQHLHKSPSPYLSHFKNVRASLNQIIDDISEKKSNANSAVGRVQEVNEEAVSILNKDMWTPRKTPSIMKKSSRTEAFKSSEKTRGHQSPSDFMFQSGEATKEVDLESENVELKRSLNGQIRQNNELLREIGALREENHGLRMGSEKAVPQQILRELEDLKRENEKLRQETIQLLRRKAYY